MHSDIDAELEGFHKTESSAFTITIQHTPACSGAEPESPNAILEMRLTAEGDAACGPSVMQRDRGLSDNWQGVGAN